VKTRLCFYIWLSSKSIRMPRQTFPLQDINFPLSSILPSHANMMRPNKSRYSPNNSSTDALTSSKPSLGVCRLAYSEPVFKPRNREVWAREGIQRKHTSGCIAGLTPTLICVVAVGLLVVIQWEAWVRGDSHLCGCCRPAGGHTVRGVSERAPVISQRPHQVHN